MVKNLLTMQETQVGSLDQEDPLGKGMATTPVSLPGEFHGQRKSLAGYSPWCRKESDTTERLILSFFSLWAVPWHLQIQLTADSIVS